MWPALLPMKNFLCLVPKQKEAMSVMRTSPAFARRLYAEDLEAMELAKATWSATQPPPEDAEEDGVADQYGRAEPGLFRGEVLWTAPLRRALVGRDAAGTLQSSL